MSNKRTLRPASGLTVEIPALDERALDHHFLYGQVNFACFLTIKLSRARHNKGSIYVRVFLSTTIYSLLLKLLKIEIPV